MNRSPLRIGLFVLTGIFVFLSAFLLTLPLLVSTGPIRAGMARELSNAIGYRIELRGTTEVSVFPVLTATLRNVAISDWKDPQSKPLVVADALSVDLIAAAALKGNMDFSAVRLDGPVVDVRAMADAVARGGEGFALLKRGIEAARRLIAENPSEPDIASLPSDPLGRISISNGTILLPRDDDEENDRITDVEGELVWLAFDRPASVSLQGQWDGETATAAVEIDEPLLFLAGGLSQVEAGLESSKVTFRYEGEGSAAANPFAQGKVAASTPSLSELLKWSRLGFSFGAGTGPAGFSGQITGTPQKFSLAEAIVDLDGNPAKGAIEFALDEGKPKVSGTLDFETLDLASILTAFVPLPSGSGLDQPIDTRFIDELDLDMRLSAAAAHAGTLRMSNVAASLQFGGGVASFDVNDSNLYSGKAQAALRIDVRNREPKGEFRLGIESMATGEFSRDIGMIRIEPQMTGNLSVLARGTAKSWRTMLQSANGTFSYRGGEGLVAGLNWSDFVGRTNSAEVFGLWSVPEGVFAVSRTEFEGKIEYGNLRLTKGNISTPDQEVQLRGIMPYADRSLALFGSVKAAGGDAEAPGRVFFVGGSWYNPYISPVLN